MIIIRVYGLIINGANEILLTSENYNGMAFTKFPGGGLMQGEGTIDCLKREFAEEFGLTITGATHFYTTDFYQESAFNPAHQIISIYYKAKVSSPGLLENIRSFDHNVIPIWKKITDVSEAFLTFPIDKKVLGMIKQVAS